MSFSGADVVGTQMALSVHLFGSPYVEWAERPLLITRRQVRALLYHLAAGQRSVPRERLCFLFWPDTPEPTARRKLTGLLSHLQRALPAPEVLITEEDRVWLDPKRAWSDTVAFDRLCDRTITLGQAADLYRGPFLDGFSLPDSPEFDLWVALERQTWERRYLKALAILIEEYAAAESFDTAIACARDYLAVDELAEDIHRRLIELYAAIGDRASALNQFEHCAAVLERELGVHPLPETRAAYKAILETRRLPNAVLDATPGWTTLPSVRAMLVGRRGVLQQLQGAYGRARAGQSGMVLISGEPGIGKTRLMQEFATRLRGEAIVLLGTGYRDTQTTPYQPVIEALRPALRAGYPWLDVPRCCLAEACRMLPELRTMSPDLTPAPVANDLELRTRLFEALRKLTLALAAGPHPLVLCLDDLQWADSTTLEWLAHLGRRTEGKRLLIVGTCRTAEMDTVAELRHSLIRAGNLTELKLGGLDQDAILQVIRNVHGAGRVQGDRAVATRLAEVTGGNPFFLLETLRALLESGRQIESLSDLADLPLADTVREVVDTRVRRLSPKARQVLEAGAVLGQTFTFELVHRTAGRREMETIDGLDELAARHLLMEQSAEYQFRHELIRMAVYQGLSYWRRRVLHRRAGETLEESQPENAAALARHFAQAEEAGRAAVYALQAGRAAQIVFAHVEAQRHFDRALTLLQQEATNLQLSEALIQNQALQVEALHGRGWALRLLGEMEAYARDLKAVSRLAESLRDGRTLAHLRWREAYTHRWFCRYAQARQAAEKGLRLSQQEGDRLLEAQCRREIGVAARETGDYEEAHTALERALALFTELGEVIYRIHTLGNLSTLQWYVGDYARSMDLAQQALGICDAADLPLQRRLPLGDLGAAAAALGDPDLAGRCLKESLCIAQKIADRTQEILCLVHLGWLCIRQKQPTAALQHLQAGIELAERVGSCTEQGWLLCGLAETYRLTGKAEQAKAHTLRALKMARATGRPYDESLALRILDRLEQGSSSEEDVSWGPRSVTSRLGKDRFARAQDETTPTITLGLL